MIKTGSMKIASGFPSGPCGAWRPLATTPTRSIDTNRAVFNWRDLARTRDILLQKPPSSISGSAAGSGGVVVWAANPADRSPFHIALAYPNLPLPLFVLGIIQPLPARKLSEPSSCRRDTGASRPRVPPIIRKRGWTRKRAAESPPKPPPARMLSALRGGLPLPAYCIGDRYLRNRSDVLALSGRSSKVCRLGRGNRERPLLHFQKWSTPHRSRGRPSMPQDDVDASTESWNCE